MIVNTDPASNNNQMAGTHSVTPGDASIPATVLCPTCGGTGEVDTALLGPDAHGTRTCQDCQGIGSIGQHPFSHTTVVEAAGWLVIDMEMPHVVARELDVSIDGRIVRIKSMPRIDSPDVPARITRESSGRPIERIVELPRPLDAARASSMRATMLDGTLRLVIPLQPSQGELARISHMN